MVPVAYSRTEPSYDNQRGNRIHVHLELEQDASMCKNTKSGHLVVVLSGLVSCVVIQTAFGRRYSELMDGRITIRRMERDTLTHLNLK